MPATSSGLGDGRAILLGEVIDRDGVRRDIQLKGSGPTPFSRQGDGRAALGPVLREYIVSEAMAALGIPTTRALAVVTTGETVWRETPLPGAVLTRVASSHVRVGTFQFFAALGDVDAIRRLADHVIARHYPEAVDAVTASIAAMSPEQQVEVMRRVHGFVAFTPDNDPHGEHDFGSFEYVGKTIFWKVDCYDRDLNYGSPDPADENVTERVLTVMLAEEY